MIKSGNIHLPVRNRGPVFICGDVSGDIWEHQKKEVIYHFTLVMSIVAEASLSCHSDHSRDIFILSFWAKRRICNRLLQWQCVVCSFIFHVVTGPFYAIFCPDTTRKYAYWMISCSDRSFFDSFSTGHYTPNCVWRSFTSFRMTVWGSGWQYGVQDDSMGFRMTEWGPEWQNEVQDDRMRTRMTEWGSGWQ